MFSIMFCMRRFLQLKSEILKKAECTYNPPDGFETHGVDSAYWDDDTFKAQKKTKGMRHEEGMAATTYKEKFKPQLKPPVADSVDDRFRDVMCKAVEIEVFRATQETLKLIEDRRAAKWAHITQLEARHDRSTSESAKAVLQKQIDSSLALLSRIDQEELVLR